MLRLTGLHREQGAFAGRGVPDRLHVLREGCTAVPIRERGWDGDGTLLSGEWVCGWRWGWIMIERSEGAQRFSAHMPTAGTARQTHEDWYDAKASLIN